jgi:hypothetical protein
MAHHTEPSDDVPEDRFEPLLLNRPFRWLADSWLKAQNDDSRAIPQYRPTNGTQLFLYSAVAVLLAWTFFAAIEGHLGSAKAGPNVGPTVDSLFSSIPGVSSVHTSGTVARFPLVEDITSWALALAAAITLGLLFRQWKIMHGVIPELVKSGALHVREEDPFARLLGQLNGRMKSRRLTLVLLGGAIAIATLIFVSLHHSGVYQTLAPSKPVQHTHAYSGHHPHIYVPPQQWAHEAYESWWAAAHHGSWWGFGVFVGLLAIYLYYLLAQYAAGVMWVVLTIRGSKLVDFRFDRTNADGFFG